MQQQNPSWYVVEAYPGEDEQATLRLAATVLSLPVTVWRPVDVVRPSTRREKPKPSQRAPQAVLKQRRDRRVARFGRFLFVRAVMTDSLLAAINHTTHVRRVLTYAGTFDPAPVPDAMIALYREKVPRRSEMPPGLAKGATVKITAGPFAGQSAKVLSVDEGGAVEVAIDLLGRLTPTVFEVGHVSVEIPVSAKSLGSQTSKPRASEMAPSAKPAKNLKSARRA